MGKCAKIQWKGEKKNRTTERKSGISQEEQSRGSVLKISFYRAPSYNLQSRSIASRQTLQLLVQERRHIYWIPAEDASFVGKRRAFQGVNSFEASVTVVYI